MTMPQASMRSGSNREGLSFFNSKLLGSSNATYVKKNTVTVYPSVSQFVINNTRSHRTSETVLLPCHVQISQHSFDLRIADISAIQKGKQV